MEREKGFEPSTSTLARLHSTTELLPRSFNFLGMFGVPKALIIFPLLRLSNPIFKKIRFRPLSQANYVVVMFLQGKQCHDCGQVNIRKRHFKEDSQQGQGDCRQNRAQGYITRNFQGYRENPG